MSHPSDHPSPSPTPAPRADPPAPMLRIHLTLLLVQALFSGFHVVGKAVLGDMPPLALAGMRVLVAAPLLLAVAWWKDRFLPPLREMPRLALLGLLGVFANQILFLVGLSYTTASNAAILMPSIPVFALGLSVLFGIQRAGSRELLGVVSAAAGAVVLLEPERFSLADGTVLGNLLILANCLSYSAFLVLQRPVVQRLPWRTVIAWSFLFGGSGVVAVSGTELAALPSAGLGAATWAGVAYIALLPTALGYFLATWAVRRSSPTLVAAYTTLQPLLSALLAVTFLGEVLGWRQGVGFVLIVAGLFGVSGAPSSPPSKVRDGS